MNLKEILVSERMAQAKKGFRGSFQNYVENFNAVVKSVDEKELKKKLKEIKEYSIKNLEKLREKAIRNLEAQGIKVFEAKDAKDARKMIQKIIPKNELVVKAKSNVLNEIEIVERMKERNEFVETDCGDFLIKICGESEMHPVTPAIHLSIEKIVEAIERKFGEKIEPKAEKIAEWVKNYLREKILKANFGLTGANAISADGNIVILENEGNISLITRLPEKHVIVAGIEKIVPSVGDAMLVCEASAIWGTGARWPTYINLISSPSKTADIQKEIVQGMHGAKEVYLILLDNGRRRALEEGLKEALYCINCGACLYFCPVYRQIFDNYGLHYFAGIGISKTAFMNGLKAAFDRGLYYCTTCKACKQNCPLEIDVAELIKKIREKAVKKGLETKANKKMIENIKKIGNPFGEMKESEIPKELYCC
ncbi:MAG: LUD domain-containing protein [Candidatus Aenigmatarchaeota archaeon]